VGSAGAEPYEWAGSYPLVGDSPTAGREGGLLSLGRLGSSRFAWSAIATEERLRVSPGGRGLDLDQLPATAEPLHLFYAGSGSIFVPTARGSEPARACPTIFGAGVDPSEKVRIEAIRAAARLGALTVPISCHLGADALRRRSPSGLDCPSEAAVSLIDRRRPEPVDSGPPSALARQDPESFGCCCPGSAPTDWEVRRRMAELFAGMKGSPNKSSARGRGSDARSASLKSLGVVMPPRARDSPPHGPDPSTRCRRGDLAAANQKSSRPSNRRFSRKRTMTLDGSALECPLSIDPEKARPSPPRAEETSHFVGMRPPIWRSGVEASVRPARASGASITWRASKPSLPAAFPHLRGRIEVELFIADADRRQFHPPGCEGFSPETSSTRSCPTDT
jgi:hypothetical protein